MNQCCFNAGPTSLHDLLCGAKTTEVTGFFLSKQLLLFLQTSSANEYFSIPMEYILFHCSRPTHYTKSLQISYMFTVVYGTAKYHTVI